MEFTRVNPLFADAIGVYHGTRIIPDRPGEQPKPEPRKIPIAKPTRRVIDFDNA